MSLLIAWQVYWRISTVYVTTIVHFRKFQCTAFDTDTEEFFMSHFPLLKYWIGTVLRVLDVCCCTSTRRQYFATVQVHRMIEHVSICANAVSYWNRVLFFLVIKNQLQWFHKLEEKRESKFILGRYCRLPSTSNCYLHFGWLFLSFFFP